MDPELRDLLRTVAVDPSGDSYTHITMYGPRNRWVIQPHNLSDFWSKYCDLVDRKMTGEPSEDIEKDPDAGICLAERPQDAMPLIAKFTFKYHASSSNIDDDNWEPYDDEFLQWLSHTYQLVLSEYFRTSSENQMEYVVTVMESVNHWYEVDKDSGQKFMMMDIRIQFPYARIDAGMQNRILRPRVIQLLRHHNVLSKMQRQPIGDWEQILSHNTINEPIMMYGSSEVRGRPKLEVTHIWPNITKVMLEEGYQPEELTIDNTFVPQNHIHVQQQSLNMAIFEDYDLRFWWPLFLSVGYWPTVLLPKEEVSDTGRFTSQTKSFGTQPRLFSRSSQYREEDDQTDMEISETFIGMLDNQRFLSEAYWKEIGRALYVSDKGGDNGLLAWIRHSEKSLTAIDNAPEYMIVDETISETCRNLYYTFANSSIDKETLAWYAREDSPDRYANWHKEWCSPSMERALTGLDTDVAIALYRVYWLDFLYCSSSTGKGKWFQFGNNRWVERNQGIELRKAISSDFVRRFEAIRAVLSRQIHDSNDENFKSSGETTIKKLTSLIGKLKTVPFKSRLMTEATEQFHDDKFISLLDTNAEILGVTNGVLEVVNGTIQYRAAKPQDYVSMCTNIPYNSNYSWQHPLVIECMKWFHQVYTDPQLCHHFLKFSASCLKGRNSDKIFPIFTGEGNNSKSMIVKLFEQAFGSYCIKFDVANITGRNMNAGAASPQLARSKSTRIAFMDEPADDVPINKETLKRWVGGDSFFARFLQENGGDVQVTFKIILICNKVPIIAKPDKAMKERTKLFPHLSTWTKDASDNEAEQYQQKRFKMNTVFERRIPILAPAFLWIMSQYYPIYDTEGLTDPPIVTETTEAYWRDNDVYAQFAADNIVEVNRDDGTRDPAARLSLNEIYQEFKSWFRDSFPGTQPPERGLVKSELSSRWGRMTGTGWPGIALNANNTKTDMTAALGGRTNPIPPAAPSLGSTDAKASTIPLFPNTQVTKLNDVSIEKKVLPPASPLTEKMQQLNLDTQLSSDKLKLMGTPASPSIRDSISDNMVTIAI